jgi:hypothetical protein
LTVGVRKGAVDMRRKERAPVLLEGTTADIEVEVTICNRCGAKVLTQEARGHAWVAVSSDGRGGHDLDFCGPTHAVEYLAELLPPGAHRPMLGVVKPDDKGRWSTDWSD